MSQTLYRKYRPQKFSEIIGQNHVKITLAKAITSKKIAHAYLFTGPRGVGKTTVARIFAKSINCLSPQDGEPCNQCDICQAMNRNNFLDLVELDAASKRKIEEIKDFKELIKYQPNIAKYKVFIIDEVHMLTDVSFNALLKTLEEPPEYAIFILCTTAAHKIPDTIISRCQRFDFKKIANQDIIESLKNLAKLEGVKNISDVVLQKIAFLSEGSLRDAQGILGQLLGIESENINEETAALILPKSNLNQLVDLWSTIIKNETEKAITIINEFNENGDDIEFLTEKLIELYRYSILYKISNKIDYLKNIFAPDLYKSIIKDIQNTDLEKLKLQLEILLNKQINLKNVFFRQLPLELAVIEMTINENKNKENNIQENFKKVIENKINQKSNDKKENFLQSEIEVTVDKKTRSIDSKLKKELVVSLLTEYYSLAKIIESSDILLSDKNIYVYTNNQLQKNQINKKKNFDKLVELCGDIFNKDLNLQIFVKTNDSFNQIENDKREGIDNIINALGGSLVEGAIEE